PRRAKIRRDVAEPLLHIACVLLRVVLKMLVDNDHAVIRSTRGNVRQFAVEQVLVRSHLPNVSGFSRFHSDVWIEEHDGSLQRLGWNAVEIRSADAILEMFGISVRQEPGAACRNQIAKDSDVAASGGERRAQAIE